SPTFLARTHHPAVPLHHHRRATLESILTFSPNPLDTHIVSRCRLTVPLCATERMLCSLLSLLVFPLFISRSASSSSTLVCLFFLSLFIFICFLYFFHRYTRQQPQSLLFLC